MDSPMVATMLSSAGNQYGYPGDQSQDDRTAHNAHSAAAGTFLVQIVAHVPDQVPHAIQGVEKEEQRKAEQDEAAQEVVHDRLDGGEAVGAGGQGQEPPGQ